MSYAYFTGRGRCGRDLGRAHIRKLVADKAATVQTEIYRGVTITVRMIQGFFVARNDYGEPRAVLRGFQTAAEAVQAEKNWLDDMGIGEGTK